MRAALFFVCVMCGPQRGDWSRHPVARSLLTLDVRLTNGILRFTSVDASIARDTHVHEGERNTDVRCRKKEEHMPVSVM